MTTNYKRNAISLQQHGKPLSNQVIRMKYGECSKCNKWGLAPQTFNESKHFLKCPNCGAPMYLSIHNPTEAGAREINKVEITEFINHKGRRCFY